MLMHPRQKTILEYFIKNKGRIPTYREIQAHLNLKSVSNIKYHIGALTKKGYLFFTERSVKVTEPLDFKENNKIE